MNHRQPRMRRWVIILIILVLVLALVGTPREPASAMSNGITQPAAPPWAADIILNSAGPSNGAQCSGALVGNGWVLTAAHCVRDLNPAAMRVLIGQGSQRATGHGASYGVQQVLLMPGFEIIDTATLQQDKNDAALIELRGFDAGRWTAVPLAPLLATVQSGGEVTLFGYGVTGWDARNQPLGGGILRRSPNGAFLDKGMCGPLLCIHRAGKTVVMSGDSGGPWLRWVAGQWQLIAVQDVTTGQGSSGPTTAEATPTLTGAAGASSNAPTLLQWVRTAARLPVEPSGTIITDQTDHTSYIIGPDGYRTEIATASVYRCFLAQGRSVVVLPRVLVGSIPQRVGVRAKCMH